MVAILKNKTPDFVANTIWRTVTLPDYIGSV